MVAITTSLNMSLRNELRLNSQTRLWIDIISMPAIDLRERIEREISENPFLEYASVRKQNDNSFASSSDFIENIVSSEGETLFDHLKEQIDISFKNKKDMSIAEHIISYINSDGYLTEPLSNIAEFLGVDICNIESVIKVIKTFDPLGVGSRDIKECLSIQLKALKKSKDRDIAIDIVEKHLDELSKKRYSSIAKELNISIKDVESSLKIIRNLEPYPGRQYDFSAVKYIVPEIFIYKENDKWTVKTDETFIAPLKISKKYSKLIKSEIDKETLKYLRDKKYAAESLINATNERKKTLYKVGVALLNFQLDFFEHGKEFIRPLTLSDISNNINLSESTISRISNSKYLETVWGTFAIKYFFSRAVTDDLGSRSVKEMIKRIIESSDTKLSDEKIRLILKSDGINIARRTVAKYRKSMSLFSSRF